MVSDTRSTRNSKDERDGRSTKKKVEIRKESSMRSPGKAQASGVRRSARVPSSSRQKTPSPQSMRKSKRLEKGTPPLTPTLKRKSERLEKYNSPSPVRRSDRGKKNISSSSPDSKKSAKEHTLSELKRKKERDLIQVTMESEKAELDVEAVGMKRKKMNARSFMALFKRQRIKIVPDGDGGLEGRDKLSDVCSDNSGGIYCEPKTNGLDTNEECIRAMVGELRDESIDIYKASNGALQKSVCSLKDSHGYNESDVNKYSTSRDMVLDEPCSKYSHSSSSVRETLDSPERLPTNCSTENVNAPESERSTCSAKARDGSVCSDISEKCVRSKEATLPSPKCENRNLLGTCLLCSKNRRVGYNSPEQELCSCNPTVDEDLGTFSACKGISDHKAAVTSETAEKCDRSRHLLAGIRTDLDGHENVCALCNNSGELLRCEGKCCKRSYHVCCLDPPLADTLPGVWHCPECVKKKLLFGVHSVSEGVESIWDVREVEVSNVEGVWQRQYLVKYHGLAHIHNQWVPEKQLLEIFCDVPKFIEKDQVVRWNTEWTVPHRLLRKRSIQDKIYVASSSVILICNYEWLVKWRGLGYDHATWELDNACFLSSPLGQNLMQDYENRCHRAKQEANEDHNGSIIKLSEFPVSQSLVKDTYVLENVNKLRERLFKCQNAVVFDDQERATTIIFFLRSLSESCWPFLIVTTSGSLSQWEAEFARLVPSIDVVVYSGNRDTRKGIRASEFYDERGHLMLQVLLSSSEGVLEDLDSLRSIKWEAIVIDDFQHFAISNDLGQIKMLPTESRILLVSGQIKEKASEYLEMLSLLECHGDLDKPRGLKSETNDNLCKLKDRLSRFIAYGSNSQVSKLLEYWVPVQISNIQLEQYCSTLLNNSVPLRSSLRNDRVGALRDILITARKCCDHPYLLDASVQERLFAEKRPIDEILDIGIKASGKLELLDIMLTEMNSRGLQVLVLFQQLISGPGGASTGNILDDFLRQRFGQKTYERVDYGVIPSKKQAAANRFNIKETGQFVFLLENRACSSTIKLSSLDVVVIYDSDWNPANDLRALRKLSIGSKVEQVKVFRLYSSFTVEERALILAKQNLNIDNNLQNFSRTTSDTLLSWGADHLFRKLDEYHADGNSTSALNFSSRQLLLSEVTKEFQAILFENCENIDSNSVISKVMLSVGNYSTKIPMLGEAKVQLKDGEEPHVFWRNLLDGKNYIWKHLREPSPRNRKRIHYDGPPSKLAAERDDAVKKRKKMVVDKLDPALDQVELGANKVSHVAKEGPSNMKACNQSQNFQTNGNMSNNNPNGMSGHNSLGAGVPEGVSEEIIVSSAERKTLHSFLQAEMMRLCQVLKLSEDVADIVLRFLEYVIKNRDVNSDSPSVVQALQISLCWIAASIKKQKIDKKDSLMLAKQLLNYQCTEEQAQSVYLILKEMYLQCPEKIVNSGNCLSAEEDTSKEKAAASDLDCKIKKIQRKCLKRMKKLVRKHQEELQEVHRKWEEEKVKLERNHKLESVLIRSIHGEGSVRTDKLKFLDNDLATKIEDLNLKKDMELKELEARQSAAISEENRKAAVWLAETKAYSTGLEAANGAQSLAPQAEELVVEGPQPSPQAEATACETRVENLVTINSQNEVGVSSSAMIENVTQSKHSGDNEETVCANQPASVEKVPDKIQSFETVPDESVGHTRSVEGRDITEKMSDEGCKIASPDALMNQRCGPDEAASGVLRTPRQPIVHSEQTMGTPQVQQDKIDKISVSAELQDLDELAVGNQSTLQIEAEPVDTVDPMPSNLEAPVTDETSTPVPSNHVAPVTSEMPTPVMSTHEAPVNDETVTPVPSNHEAPVIENSDKLHSVLVDRSRSCNQSPANEENDQRRSSSQTAEPGVAEVLPHESIPQSGENSDIHNNHLTTGSVNSVAHGQSVESSAPSTNDVTRTQVVVSTAERPNQSVLQLGIDAGHLEGPSYLLHLTHQPTSGSSTPSMLADPLQNEFETLRRESEQLEKTHRDVMSLLNSDCEKEIQEMIAQIRKRYEVKCQETEAEYRLKRNELDKNQNKVLMNKLLAAVFRSKCLDPKPAGNPGMQQGVPSSFVQHMHQLSLLSSTRPPHQLAPTHPITPPAIQTLPQQLSRSRPFIINQNFATPTVTRCPTIVNQNAATPPVIRSSPTIVNQNAATPPVIRSSPTIVNQNAATPPVIRSSPTIVNQNTSTPALQAMQNTAALFSGTPSRPPPVINAITPSRSSRAGGEIRSAAPHLQSFRPSSAATSVSVPQIRPLHRLLPSQAPALAPSLPALNNNLVVSQNRAEVITAPPKLSLSTPENRTSSDLPEICSTFHSLEPSDLESLANVLGNQTSTVANDVVCLSDDD